jgi:hypothetical protein
VLGFFTFRAGVLFCPLWDKGVMAGGMLDLWMIHGARQGKGKQHEECSKQETYIKQLFAFTFAAVQSISSNGP